MLAAQRKLSLDYGKVTKKIDKSKMKPVKWSIIVNKNDKFFKEIIMDSAKITLEEVFKILSERNHEQEENNA